MKKELILYLLCHANARKNDGADFKRCLSSRGRNDLIRLCSYLENISPLPEIAFCSRDDRCRQTAEEIGFFLKDAQVFYHHLLYLASGYTLLDLLGALNESVSTALILGHKRALKQFIRLSLENDEVWKQKRRKSYSSSFFVTLSVPRKDGWRAFDLKKATLKDVFYP